MKYFFCQFILHILIKLSFEQNKNYCNLNEKCNNCITCGEKTNNYCYCNFYNVYCKDDNTNTYTILSDFLFNFDGCIIGNGNLETVCGNSNINIDRGMTKTINFVSNYYTNYLCFYNVKKIKNNNNDIIIKIKKETNVPINFNMHSVIYYNDDNVKISSRFNALANSNYIEITESSVEKISVYIDIQDGFNIDKVSISFEMENLPIKKIENNKNKYNAIMYGLIFGALVLVILIIVIICFIRKSKKKKEIDNNKNNSSNAQLNKKNIQLLIAKENTEKINNLFKKEIIPKIYYKKDIINNCFNCSICLEEFKDGSSIIINTKCNHTFHFKCFKNWVYKNILLPKCPNCNLPIIYPDNNQNNTLTYSSTLNSFIDKKITNNGT